jgi:hypothetical protein
VADRDDHRPNRRPDPLHPESPHPEAEIFAAPKWNGWKLRGVLSPPKKGFRVRSGSNYPQIAPSNAAYPANISREDLRWRRV